MLQCLHQTGWLRRFLNTPLPSCLQFLNQAGALVHVYTDGTVLVTHGGVEMGQGLHTKVAQVGGWSSALQCCLQPPDTAGFSVHPDGQRSVHKHAAYLQADESVSSSSAGCPRLP